MGEVSWESKEDDRGPLGIQSSLAHHRLSEYEMAYIFSHIVFVIQRYDMQG